jgi:serine/threonine protein kinase
MARIYIARTTGIGAFERHVVLKMILPERAHDQTAVHMFLDEARLAASLNHQNVAQVFEVGQDAGIHFLAMEYVHGQDLRALLAKAGSEGKRVPLELALAIVAGAAAGLHHAHERRTSDGAPMGIVHRDVSPSNIMVGYDGAVKLLDFGIAKATMRSVETQSGIIKGKFAYMSPEQCRGRDVDRRGDVFSLGIILYEVSTQHRCFRADSDFDTMHRIVTGDIVRPTRLVLGYPADLEAIVMKALAVDPNERYASAGDMLEAIESFAAAARMPLSAGALGRFMREMFGDVLEPWLAPGRIDAAAPREHTISNTNRSGPPMHLPPGPGLDADAHEVASWSAPPYAPIATPAPQLYAPAATPAPQLYDPYARPSAPSYAAVPMAFAPGGSIGSSSGASSGSSSGSSSGASHSYPVLPQPYPVGSQLIAHPGHGEPAADLRPRRRWRYLGAAITALGVVVVIAMVRRGPSEPARPLVTAPAPPVPVQHLAPVVAPTPAPADKPPMLRDEITVHVGSIPAGAEVSRDGALLGVTPLDVHWKRATGATTLTVHRAKFADATAMIDLSGDFSRELTLQPLPDEPAPSPSAAKPPAREAKHTDPAVRRPSPPAASKKCQPPAAYNPFDTTCGGEACPPCS